MRRRAQTSRVKAQQSHPTTIPTSTCNSGSEGACWVAVLVAMGTREQLSASLCDPIHMMTAILINQSRANGGRARPLSPIQTWLLGPSSHRIVQSWVTNVMMSGVSRRRSMHVCITKPVVSFFFQCWCVCVCVCLGGV